MIKKLFIGILLLLLPACAAQTLSQEKTYTKDEVKQILSNPSDGQFVKVKEPCFWAVGIGWEEFEVTIASSIPQRITCKGDTF